MCKKSPLPRCYAHAQAALDKYEQQHPGLAKLDDVQLYTAHTEAVAKRDRAKAAVLGELMDRRLDRDSSATGLKNLEEALRAAPADNVLWYRLHAARAARAARQDAAEARDSYTQWSDREHKSLIEGRERLARTEARYAALLAVRGTLGQRDITALIDAYDAALEDEASARLYAANQEPSPDAPPRVRLTWRNLREEAPDQARALALSTHRDAAIATWQYPHAVPREGRREDKRGTQIEALDGVRIAVLTKTPVRFEFNQVTVDTAEDAARRRVWRAGYHSASPTGQVIVRQVGRAA